MKKSVIIAVASLATVIFGIEPSELVTLYRTALTNDKAMVELRGVLKEHGRESIWELQSRMNGLELLLMHSGIDSVSATSENLTIAFRSGGFMLRHNGVWRRAAEYIENNEALILTPDQEVSFSDGLHAYTRIAPVSFKNKKKGFRIIDVFFFSGDERRDIAYVALSDKPIEVSEEDVEMVMENGEWKTFEREGEVATSPPSREAVKTITQTKPSEPPAVIPPESSEVPDVVAEDETLVIVTGDEPSEEKSKATTFWLYIGILSALCAGVVLWRIRRKK